MGGKYDDGHGCGKCNKQYGHLLTSYDCLIGVEYNDGHTEEIVADKMDI